MTPNPDLYQEFKKHASEAIAHAILDGQNQIYDLNAGKATGEEVNQRMQASHDYHLNLLLLSLPFLEWRLK